MSNVLLFLGCERSGTTFVMETLSRFYSIAHGNESLWVIRGWHEFQKRRPSTRQQQERFLKHILADWYFANMANYHQVYFDHLQFVQPGAFDYRKFVDQVFQHIGDVKQKAWVLNKTCPFCEHMPVVDTVFRNPKVVHIVRDGRDVALSLLKVKAWGPISAYGAARWWSRRVNMIQDYAAKNMNGRYLEIRYEDLLQKPAAMFEQIASFYGVYDAQRHAKLVESVTIKKGNAAKWSRELLPRDIQIFERVAGNALEKNGYALANNSSALAPLPVWTEAVFRIRESLASRIGLYPLWFRALKSINRLVGAFPRLQQRFFRCRIFENHFNWNKNLEKLSPH